MHDNDPVTYHMKEFVEKGLSRHSKVASVTNIDHHRYSVRRTTGGEIEIGICQRV